MNTVRRPIEFGDIPSREEFKELTLGLLRKGITNSDQMRQVMSKEVTRETPPGRGTRTPSSKFTNEHAWTLVDLVVNHLIEKTSNKEYRLA
jgi:hypothetical protein